MRILATTLSVLCCFSFAIRAAERCALVIGVSDYQSFSPLDNPRQDHAEMVAALSRLNFQVTEKHNARREDILSLAQSFAQQNPDAREVVFYYSGHGLQVQGRNYLTGVDSEMDVQRGLDQLDRTDLKGDALTMAKEAHIRQVAEAGLVSLDVVLGHLERGGRKECARVIILDCCRDNPVGTKSLASKSILASKSGLAKVDAPRGMLIAFAAREGKTAAQTEVGKPSLYTLALLRHIGTPGLEAEQIFKRTRATVLELSQDAQEPAEYTNLTGSLVFNRESGALTHVPSMPVPQPSTPVPSPAPVPTPRPEPAAPAGPTPGAVFRSATGLRLAWVAPLNAWVGTTEVTQAQFEEVMGANPSEIRGGSLPVTNVSWTEALEFCARLTALDARAFTGGRFAYRLPSDADYSVYVEGALLSQAVTSRNGKRSRPAEVASLEPNAYGLYDVRGNVWEWLADPFDRSMNSAATNARLSKGLASRGRVLRGGSYTTSDSTMLEVDTRASDAETLRDRTCGFRVILKGR